MNTKDRMATSNNLQLLSYGFLLTGKFVVPSERTGYIAVDKDLFVRLMARSLRDIPIDEEWYLTTYPDVKDAIVAGTTSSAAYHYAHFGFFEHRMPRNIVVNPAWYIQVNPDVKEAIRNNTFASA